MKAEHWKVIPSAACPPLQHRVLPCIVIQWREKKTLLHCTLLYTNTSTLSRGKPFISYINALSLKFKYLRT